MAIRSDDFDGGTPRRLASACSTRTTTAVISEYRYDALGRRVQKEVGSDITRYYHSGQQIIEERNGSDAVVATYTYGDYIDEPLTMDRASERYFYHTNRMYSVYALTDSSGDLIERYSYTPYGVTTTYDDAYADPQTTSRVDNPFTYTGQELDGETLLLYYNARTYDPTEGRFKQLDPIGFRSGDLNLYRYVGNRPTIATDPHGLFESSEVNQIGSLDDAIKSADNVSYNNSMTGLMRWGRFTAAMGGSGAWEAMTDPDSGSTANTPYPRYIYTCRCGMIDLRHFYQLMYIAVLEGNASAVKRGIDHEEGAEEASKYAPEDITSNALGAYFGSQQSWFQRRSVFLANLKSILLQCDPVDWGTLTDAEQNCIINYYAIDKGGDINRRKTAGSDGDCCNVCKEKSTSFPFATSPDNPAMITGVEQ